MRVTSVLRRVSASTTRALSCSISIAVCLLQKEIVLVYSGFMLRKGLTDI